MKINFFVKIPHPFQEGTIKSYLDRNLTTPRFPKDSPIARTFKKLSDCFFDTIRVLNVSDSCVGKIARWDPLEMLDSSFIGTTPMKCGFTVLNHGDDWINNMMFKLAENGDIEDFKFLDFQMSFWGSPVADLFYFLLSSVRDDVKAAKFDELIEYYHEMLVESLKRVNYEQHIPTLEELKEEVMLKGELASEMIFGIMFVCKYTSEKEIDFADMFSGQIDEESMKLMYRNDNFMAALEAILPFLEERGFLDLPGRLKK